MSAAKRERSASDILIGVAKEFKVSTDYILGLSTVSVRKSYDISELGLSEGAVRGLVTGAVDVQILNRLLEHRNFPKLIDLSSNKSSCLKKPVFMRVSAISISLLITN